MRHPLRASLGLFSLFLPSIARADLDLDAFIKAPDPSYKWEKIESREFDGVKAHQLRLTSQTWQGKPWMHDVQIYEPAETKSPNFVLLFITGGANKADNPRFRHAGEGLAMVKACGARVVVLPQVPNQPLMGGKVEDDLIAETFTRYLDTHDDTLPLLQPMAKSAVRAMDAYQEWAKGEGRPVPAKFVVTGASKRGWTTWLVGAVDPRVAAIAPMVIPTLNMRAQNKHQLDTWGAYSEQIADYTRRGLTEKVDTPDGAKLWRLIDPYTYRDRLTMPKLQINGTNDPYWTLDSMNLYWDDLKGPKSVVYLPNAVHNLQEHRDWAVNGIGALFRHVASGQELPQFTWDTKDHPPGHDIHMGVHFDQANPKPKKAVIWMAQSKTKDFRQSRWAEVKIGDPTTETELVLHTDFDKDFQGFAACFADLTFEIDGLEYHLSSQIAIFGPPKGGGKP